MPFFRYSLILTLLAIACQPASEEQLTAEHFLKNLSQGNYRKAQQYVHPSSLPLMIDFENIGVSSDTMRERPVPYTLDSIKHVGTDSAWVYFTWNQLPEKILLVKEKKHWRIILR